MSSTGNITAVLLAALLAGCVPCKRLTTVARDSLRVEIMERVVYRDTTVYKDIPRDSQSQTVCDTISHLENDFAMSDARIMSDGTLFHSLETKPQMFGIRFRMPERRRDSIVYRNFYRVDKVYVPRNLTAWQRLQMTGFWVFVTAIVVAIGLWIRKKVH